MIWVLNAQTRNPNRPSLKYSSGGSGPLWKKNEAFCLSGNGGGQYIIVDNSTKRNKITEKTNIEGNMPDIEIRDEERGQRAISYFSMFSGIGGFESGIFNALEQRRCGQEKDKVENDVSLPIEQSNERQCATCIGYSEIDKYADAIYQHNFKGHKNYGDATTIIPEQLPDFDLLVGGFPCQAFSIAGKRLGFDDTRGTLFFEIARILKVKRPKHFILENVKGLLSHDNGRTFKTIIATLVELGYGVEWQVLNSKNHGVPQNRERVFIVGYFGGEGCGKVFPVGEVMQVVNDRQNIQSDEATGGGQM